MLRLFTVLLVCTLAVVALAACGGPRSAAVPTATPAQAATPTSVSTRAPTATSAAPTPTATPSSVASRSLTGVGLSPKSFAPADFTGFFKKAKEVGSVVSWAGDWTELGNATGGGPKVVTELAPTYGYTPVVIAQFFTQSSGKPLRPLDAATLQSYRESAQVFAGKYRPKYLGLGIEVNVLYEKSPSDFDLFVRLFQETYGAIKSVSPETKVFTVFQLEKMKGLNGGLFGGSNDPAKAQWRLLELFPRADIVAFTTYPGLVYKDPADILADYYSEIKSHTSSPIAFTEIGWHSAAGPSGWESSEAEQARFAQSFFSLTQGLDKELAIWSFLYDQDTVEPFNSMGLLRGDGGPRPVWEEWAKGK